MSITVRNETAMKYGMRKPSWKKSLSARTKGRATRAVKRALIPGSGKKGMGWLHPKRKLYNAIYKKTTFSLFAEVLSYICLCLLHNSSLQL